MADEEGDNESAAPKRSASQDISISAIRINGDAISVNLTDPKDVSDIRSRIAAACNASPAYIMLFNGALPIHDNDEVNELGPTVTVSVQQRPHWLPENKYMYNGKEVLKIRTVNQGSGRQDCICSIHYVDGTVTSEDDTRLAIERMDKWCRKHRWARYEKSRFDIAWVPPEDPVPPFTQQGTPAQKATIEKPKKEESSQNAAEIALFPIVLVNKNAAEIEVISPAGPADGIYQMRDTQGNSLGGAGATVNQLPQDEYALWQLKSVTNNRYQIIHVGSGQGLSCLPQVGSNGEAVLYPFDGQHASSADGQTWEFRKTDNGDQYFCQTSDEGFTIHSHWQFDREGVLGDHCNFDGYHLGGQQIGNYPSNGGLKLMRSNAITRVWTLHLKEA